MLPVRPAALAVAVAVTAGIAVPAAATPTPESGTVSDATPKVTWASEPLGGYGVSLLNLLAEAAGQRMLCEAPTCETFALTVADPGRDLTIALESSESDITQVEVEKPDGSAVFANGVEVEPVPVQAATTFRFKDAPTGNWTIRYQDNASGPTHIDGIAELSKPPVVEEPPATVPPGTPAPPSGGAAAPTLALKAPKLSARKLARTRKLAVKVSSTGPVTAVRIVLARAGKVVATGTLARLNGTSTVRLKVKRAPKPGRYTLGVKARNGGQVLGASVPVRLAR